MIVFLNFAPITFMGGAEKWMQETAEKISTYEDASLISVSPRIANVYGNLVLKRSFEDRISASELHNHRFITPRSLIPFSKGWRSIRSSLKKAKIVYIRYELLEFLLLIYFGDFSVLKKSIAGVHSPFIYETPKGFFDYLHNVVYGSQTSRLILSKMKKVHVVNLRTEKSMTQDLKLSNVAYVPNGVRLPDKQQKRAETKNLHILFVGELSERKGVDVLIEIIKQAPKHFYFTIVGNGPLASDIKSLSQQNSQCSYKGYLQKDEMQSVYEVNDVLLLPSRAESMPLVILEALSHGLLIVDSLEIRLFLDEEFEYSCDNKNIATYLQTLEEIWKRKKEKKIDRDVVRKYFQKNFSAEIIDPMLLTQVFDLKL